jgi:hypothetical protein
MSIKEFLAIFVPSLLGLVVVVYAMSYFFGFSWLYLLLVVAFAYLMYREYYKWSRNHLKCDPNDGVLYVEDNAHPFILFFINGSSDDPIPLDDLELETPTVSFLDKWVFHCGTLGAGKRTLKGVKHMDELLAIQKYIESFKKQTINVSKEQVDYLAGILETLESMGRDLKTLVDFVVKDGPAASPPPPITHAQPIPIRPQTHPTQKPEESEEPETDPSER